MESFLHPELPASAKVLSLVRLHHGLPVSGTDEIPVTPAMQSNRLARIWRTGARLNHLNARRRRIRLDDIPESAFPVVLELGNGSQFLILKEKVNDRAAESYIVQFPDSRESLVRAERIREIYDGNCIFLSPRDAAQDGSSGTGSGRGGWLRRMLSRIGSFPMKRGLTAAILCNSITLAGVIGVVMSHRMAFPRVDPPSLFVPATGVFMAAAVILGILRIRREALTEKLPAALIDCAFIPFYGLATVSLAGWSAVPFFWIAGMVGACLLLSHRLGQVASRLRRARSYILSATFLTGAAGCWTGASLGLLNPALMAGGIILGTCLVNLLIESDVLWQEARLAAMV